MADIATIKLADSYDALKLAAEKASKAKADAIKALETSTIEAHKAIQKLGDAESKAVQELAKAGTARLAIYRAIPSEITNALEAANAELRQHAGSVETAERTLAGQLKHHDKIMEQVGSYPLEKDPANGDKPALSQRARYEKAEAEGALKVARASVKAETDRVATLKAKIAKLEKERDAFVKELRARAEKPPEKEKAVAK